MHVHVFVSATIVQLFVVHLTTVFGSCSAPSPHVVNSNQIPDYYWKEYIGIIPQDAVEGGTDAVGNPTYVGQAYIQKYELLPGFITIGCKTLTTVAYALELTPNENVKILCARDKRKFEWVPTKKEDLHMLIGRHFVVGGSEVGKTLYIGRVHYENRIIVGKFFNSVPLVNYGLAIPYQGKPVNFNSFEVLTYNVSKYGDETIPVPCIDVRSQ
ncbi:hypothetical protein ILUMI_18437 [Ignelater luminosus]|uniref:Uncharacterized protein n=1 Tax=Ignelater luminosus TaxID=2038154 RepID=A0A8K0CLB4_IGNLU|nr:hypothetical protein ILUMI_18437 [Ignelater luminosus]